MFIHKTIKYDSHYRILISSVISMLKCRRLSAAIKEENDHSIQVLLLGLKLNILISLKILFCILKHYHFFVAPPF